jgi:hypothetical protein
MMVTQSTKLKIDETVLFTPNVTDADAGNPLRAYMQISKADKAAFAELPEGESRQTVEVFDTVSQQSYIVRRASCGGSCYCAAEIVGKGLRTEQHW